MAFTIETATGERARYSGRWHGKSATLIAQLKELTKECPMGPSIADYDGALIAHITAIMPGTVLIRRDPPPRWVAGRVY